MVKKWCCYGQPFSNSRQLHLHNIDVPLIERSILYYNPINYVLQFTQ